MFQRYDQVNEGDRAGERVASLRAVMREEGIDWLVVPHADEYQSEYLPANAERLAWLSGFTGSAGGAVIGLTRAAVFSDGRYTLQLAEQTDGDVWERVDITRITLPAWIEDAVGEGEVVATDAMTSTSSAIDLLRRAAEEHGATYRATDGNLVDRAWEAEGARPTEPQGAVSVHHERFAGRLAKEKIADLQEEIAKHADVAVLSETAGVSWLFNIRGADVVHKPLVLARAIVPAEGYPDLFVARAKLGIETRAYLTQLANLHEPAAFGARLRELAADARVWLDPAQAPAALFDTVEDAGGTVVRRREPTVLPMAIKNEKELAGAREAQSRDGAAVATFLAWLDRQPSGSVDEITAARELEDTRRRMAGNEMPLREISFDTISGAGPNGAIVHYRVSEASNRKLEAGELYLSDSGAQYDDGTTDITRTVAIGEPDDEQRRCYTLVLQGHIAIATARFPEGTRGVDIDVLARDALWRAGLDYAHGTGHGVGSYLGVHEGPQGISRRSMEPFEPGMIVSNEPGYYREGTFGIRLENLVVVQEPAEIEGGDVPMMAFETITLAPLDRRLIRFDMLSPREREWIDAYHARVRDELSDRVETEARDWLERATAPLEPPAT